MDSDHINAHLPQALAEHVKRVVGPKGYFETPDEYIRALIRRDMDESDLYQARQSIKEGYEDIAAGRYFKSSGDFLKDRKTFAEKEANGWD